MAVPMQEELRGRTTASLVLEAAVMTMITMLAFIGNTMVCWAVYNNKRLRTLPNMYVVTLAISDILMGSFCMPLSLEVLIKAVWTKPFAVCQLQGFLSWFFAFTSLQTMTAMAINRYYRVVKPNRYGNYFTTRRVYISIVAIVIIASLGPGIAMMSRWSVNQIHYGKVLCFMVFISQGIEKGYIGFVDAFYITTPIMIISVCYLKIFLTVRSHTKNLKSRNAPMALPTGTSGSTLPSNEGRANLTVNIEEVKVTKTLFATVVGFVTCWTPIAVIDMLDAYSSHQVHVPREVYFAWILLGYGSSSINPIIYGILNRSFRREFIKIFSFKWRLSRSVVPEIEVVATTTMNLQRKLPRQSEPEMHVSGISSSAIADYQVADLTKNRGSTTNTTTP
ncbi:melatonin receptor type 1A [Nematostella vectensis]|uniref:melatonin receptor type 1A n=1 Tax=Nematostella vectensis TaxID=45351 RepID=UPI00138FF182|nr:melatonin receptor type 1A [Nematostella vectensis]